MATQPKRNSTIGLDYGTHSTKVVHRIRDEELNNRYLRIVHASYAFIKKHGRVEQGARFSLLAEELGSVLDRVVPGSAERRFFVAPETVAPIVSLKLEPIVDLGIFLIADMGAATTEMSICAVNDETSTKGILAYSDSTVSQGGDILGEIEGMRVGQSQRKLELFLKVMRSQANKVWSTGFLIDQANKAARKRWSELRILLTGGATHDINVRKFFDKKVKPNQTHFLDESVISIARHYPGTLECDSGFEDEDLSLFAVANGLSVQRAKWPEFEHGDQIESLEAPEKEEPELVPSYLEIG